MVSNEKIIEFFNLSPLPSEGGFYKETYRDSRIVEINLEGEIVSRSASTAIYYMVTPESFSTLHRLKQSEVFHFYMGDAAEMLLLHPNGKVEKIILGSDLSKGEKPQVIVPARTWQGVRLREQSENWSLMGTTVSPGFEFADCELGDRVSLQNEYPSAKDLISRFTRLDGE